VYSVNYQHVAFRYLTLLDLPHSQRNMSVLFYDGLINVASLHKLGISQKMGVYAVHTITCMSKQRMVSLVCIKVCMVSEGCQFIAYCLSVCVVSVFGFVSQCKLQNFSFLTAESQASYCNPVGT